jgi:peptide/nickel transport system substrate-binding protein
VPVNSRVYALRRGIVAAAVVSLVIGGVTACTTPDVVVDGSTVTVAFDQPITSFNDHTSFGNTSANSAIRGATSSSFAYYDSTAHLVLDESFGQMSVVSQKPFAVQYTLAAGLTWSDGVPIDSADLLLAWAADSGALNTAGFDPTRFVNSVTGQFEQFPDDVVFFDGAARSGLEHARSEPLLGDDGRSITIIFDRYLVDWQLAFELTMPAHVVGATVMPGVSRDDESPGVAAKNAVIAAIEAADTASLHDIAQAWNSAYVVAGADEAVAEGARDVVTSGPYSVESLVAGESITLTVNPHYRGALKPHFETVVVRTVSDPLEAVAALRTGEVDVIAPRPSDAVVTALRDDPTITVDRAPSVRWEHLDLQFAGGANDTFENPLLRQAFLATVPRQAIVDELVRPSDAEAVVRTTFVGPPVAGERVAQPDISLARSLIELAAVKTPEVCVLFDPANPQRVAEFTAIQTSAEEAGFDVTDCSRRDWEGFLGISGAYDAALFAWRETSAAVTAPEAWLRSDSQISNFSNYDNPAVDALLDQLRASTTDDERLDIRAQIDVILAEDHYGLPLFDHPAIVAYRSDVDGVAPGAFAGGLLWNLWDWQPNRVMASEPVE